jgi:hypothetical protein
MICLYLTIYIAEFKVLYVPNLEDKNLNFAYTMRLYVSYSSQVNKDYFPKHLYHIDLCSGYAFF